MQNSIRFILKVIPIQDEHEFTPMLLSSEFLPHTIEWNL